ncbi:MAG: hypothetical protein N2510_00500 [Ignavibacteria bacterium]|nr:hypothetical protein [Ignavibacteria bacterium]
MKKLIFINLVLFIASSSVISQTDKNGGSLYSIFGIGDLNYTSSARTESMGILGISLYGDYVNTLNPATWTRIQSTLFSTKFNLENIRSAQGDRKAERTYANFEGFNLSVPLNKGNGWILSLGMNSYSNVNYDTRFRASLEGENYTQTYSGNGGLNRLNVGFSYIIFRYFSFGAQFNYGFGNINKSLDIDFDNAALFDTRNISSNTLSGFYFNTGIIFHGFGKIFNSKKLDNLTLGLVFSSPAKLNSKITSRYNRSVNNIDTIESAEGKIEVPMGFGIGISNTFSGKLTVAADLWIQQWDKYLYYGNHPEEIKDNFRAGIGIEYTPSSRYDESFIKKISYRLGATYIQDYLKIKGENINQISVSAGLSLPISKYNSLDVFIKYGIRGKNENGLIKDNVVKFGASVKLGELWFLQPKDDF